MMVRRRRRSKAMLRMQLFNGYMDGSRDGKGQLVGSSFDDDDSCLRFTEITTERLRPCSNANMNAREIDWCLIQTGEPCFCSCYSPIHVLGNGKVI